MAYILLFNVKRLLNVVMFIMFGGRNQHYAKKLIVL